MVCEREDEAYESIELYELVPPEEEYEDRDLEEDDEYPEYVLVLYVL